jgi:hypothetical protein
LVRQERGVRGTTSERVRDSPREHLTMVGDSQQHTWAARSLSSQRELGKDLQVRYQGGNEIRVMPRGSRTSYANGSTATKGVWPLGTFRGRLK